MFETKHDEADIRLLYTIRWTHPQIKVFTESETKRKHSLLYPPCIITEGNPFLLKMEKKEVKYILHHRTFDIPKDIAQAVAKGFIGIKNDDETGNVPGYFITKLGGELIRPKWNGVKIKKEEKKK